MADDVLLSRAEAEDLAMRACKGAGAGSATARSLVDATLSAAFHGPPTLGFPHLVDYLHSFREGRINRQPMPKVERPFAASFELDADRGVAQLGFDLVFDDFAAATRSFGVALFTQTNSYTAGELGYYVRRLAASGLVGIAATNANAMVVAKAGGPAVYSTNPLALGFPLGEGSAPVVIDQASSATAFVNIVAAASAGRAIPEGWAVDGEGRGTTDAEKALAGALLPFGGRKGANVALMVELLSAGLSGGPWSLDTADFRSGSSSPAIGLTVIALMPGSPGSGRIERARRQCDRLQERGIFVPGVSFDPARSAPGGVRVSLGVLEAVRRFADG